MLDLLCKTLCVINRPIPSFFCLQNFLMVHFLVWECCPRYKEYTSLWQASGKQSYVSRPTWEVAWLLIPTPSLKSSSPNEWQPFKRGAGRELYFSVISLNTLHRVYNSAVHAATCVGLNEAYYDGYIFSRGHITNNQGKRVHRGVSGTIIG